MLISFFSEIGHHFEKLIIFRYQICASLPYG